MNWKPGLLVLFTVVVERMCHDAGRTDRHGDGARESPMRSSWRMTVSGEWAQQQIGGTSPSQTANEHLAAERSWKVEGAGMGALSVRGGYRGIMVGMADRWWGGSFADHLSAAF